MVDKILKKHKGMHCAKVRAVFVALALSSILVVVK